MRKPFILLATTLSLSLGVMACTDTTSPSDATDTEAVAGSGDAISLRQDMMKNWKDASDMMGEMIDNPDTFNADTFKEQAKFLAGDAGNAWQHFANEADKGDATDTVWSNPDDFQAKAQNFETMAANLNTAAQSATSATDVQPAYAELKDSCKACHQTFKN